MSLCMYCDKDSRLDALMERIADLNVSTVYLYKEHSYPGRCVVVFHRHVRKLTDLTDEEYVQFLGDVRKCAHTIDKLYQPDKINYLVLGDLSPHLHMHIVPKYKDGCDWGEIFHMMPSPQVYAEDNGFRMEIERIRKELETNS